MKKVLALVLVLAMLMGIGATAFAEGKTEMVEAGVIGILFETPSDMSEMYLSEDMRTLYVASAITDTLLLGDLIDSETLLKMVQNNQVYIARDADNTYYCFVYGATGDFHTIYTPGASSFLASYDSAATFADPADLMNYLQTNGLFVTYYKVPSLDVLAAMSAILKTLQGEE